MRRPKAEPDSGGQHLDTLTLLREIYLTNLEEGSARGVSIGKRLGLAPAWVHAALREASAKKLVRTVRGTVDLTSAGRRRLKVVMMGGAFEVIHPGHIQAVSDARRLGNTLVVVVATDESIERNKGRPPVTDQSMRVALVSSLRQVDLALPGNKGNIYEILLKIRPDIIALGYDQRHSGQEIEREAERRGIPLRTARLGTTVPDLKTSKILLSL